MIAALLRRFRRAPPSPRLLGDRARDARRWEEAAAHYRRHLAAHPADAAIWVQLGHAEKEAGRPDAAEAAYREAMALAPRDHDPPLHLGHVLKLLGRMEEAIRAYQLSAELAPVNHAAEELRALLPAGAAPAAYVPAARPAGPAPETPERAALRAAAEANPGDAAAWRALAEALLAAHDRAGARAAAERAFTSAPDRRHWQLLRRIAGAAPEEGTPGGPDLYDVTDLLNLLQETGRATGIQRVQLGLVEGILNDAEAAARARFVFLAERMGPLWTIAPADLRALLAYCLAERHDLERARQLVAQAMDRARPTHLASARRFLILGAFWFWAGAPAALARLRAAGVRIGVLVYDLIPVTHPEYTSEGTVRAYRQGLAEGARLWDFALTISAWTARELEGALAGLGAPALPIRPVPLAHRMNVGAPPGPEDWPAPLADLRGGEFVLCVGTIEARKNHLALFQAWRLLLREGFAPPPLVLVGRPGWRVEDLMAQLEATRFLDGRIRLVHGVSDPELEALYRACLFTVFPSFTEGWGLPVGEALALGKVVLASGEGATPEAGAGFALPIDAYNPRGIAAEVRRLCTDRAALAAAEARIREGFRPRGWPEVAADFLAKVAELSALPPMQHEPATPPELAPGGRIGLEAEEDWAAAALLGAGFEAPGPGGAALVGPAGALALRLAAPGTVLLRLAARPWAEMNRVGLFAGQAPPRWFGLMPGQEVLAAIALPAGETRLGLVVEGPLAPPKEEDPRPIRVALKEVALAPPPGGAVAPRLPVVFGARAEGPGWAGLLAEGWDLAADSAGVEPLAPAPVIRFRAEGLGPGEALRVVLHLAPRPGAAGRLRHPGGETPLPAAPRPFALPLALTTGEGGVVEIGLAMAGGGVPPLRLAALQWAAEGDLPGRLALLEGIAGVEPTGGAEAGGLAALEARLTALAAAAGPPPGGETGQALRLLSALRRG
ncbi:glycosyltransferase [Rubritepida flocculans]|uniref:glycosyltransferase n=1 Tax=Rubritepida flocculans TaxID=182403 RepID=UPI000688CB03|nr:glycosyltransferase [Rubritepida flocculans]